MVFTLTTTNSSIAEDSKCWNVLTGEKKAINERAMTISNKQPNDKPNTEEWKTIDFNWNQIELKGHEHIKSL